MWNSTVLSEDGKQRMDSARRGDMVRLSSNLARWERLTWGGCSQQWWGVTWGSIVNPEVLQKASRFLHWFQWETKRESCGGSGAELNSEVPSWIKPPKLSEGALLPGFRLLAQGKCWRNWWSAKIKNQIPGYQMLNNKPWWMHVSLSCISNVCVYSRPFGIRCIAQIASSPIRISFIKLELISFNVLKGVNKRESCW